MYLVMSMKYGKFISVKRMRLKYRSTRLLLENETLISRQRKIENGKMKSWMI